MEVHMINLNPCRNRDRNLNLNLSPMKKNSQQELSLSSKIKKRSLFPK